ncbi:hypothetical protein WR25_25115 isoform G [Diploscapter pachys]|uniref:Uncharacterized protein n=1 Tax=Diploscapter pachys TaxID=2018661 RepID=A0A2A2LC03_9BILA|nr:hypothetical protein WR25_25115 isoform A [Diploscapter pachys]PAV83728.1 hypothetical protein WR25_25115 isoform E [Diploscapter pachys]PAV83729.1 hypothetical protein WR25_25115 isoform F [Diploscapter pachys]PAV83730.1 hypothetical protein WR25_25115 isoform G [Diploscapter pachys]
MNVSPYHKKSYDDKIDSLHKQMRQLRIECGKLLNRQNESEKILCCATKAAETSSAYNTGGESCRSDSHTPEGVNNSPHTLHRPITTNEKKTDNPSTLLPDTMRASELRRCSPLPSCSQSSLFLSRSSLQNSTNQINQLKSQMHQNATKEAFDYSKKFRQDDLTRIMHDILNHCRIPSLSIVMKDKEKEKEEPRASNVKTKIINIAMPKFFRNTISQTKLYLLNEQPTGSKTNLNSNTKDQKEDAKDVLKRSEEIKMKMEKEREIALEMEREKERIENEKNAKKEELTMNEEFQEEPQYKWKVKRRSDGSRYVVRRAVRGEVLKKREAEINRERTGISTDDDAMSDLKLGHFHTREERKRQLERERLRKLQQQNTKLQQRTLATEQLINQLRDKKLQKKKQKEILDEFITTQEMLSERCKEGASLQGICTITTV